MKVSGPQNATESAEYEAVLEPRGKVADGDSLGWTVTRTTVEGAAASVYEKAVMKAKRKMSLGFVRLGNSCLKFGNGVADLREALTKDAVESLKPKPEQVALTKAVIGGYLGMDASVSSLMAVAPSDLLSLSGMKAGKHDSLLMAHPYYAAVPLQYSIDFHAANGGLEGTARLDTPCLAKVPEDLRDQLGHVGRFIRRVEDGSHMELTVVDTFIVPAGLFVEERRVLTRVFRTDLPLP